ncbi:MAG TPA: hypothetical protein DET40_02930 [Lentisphaeria bacterium]|nr:hypothetical protein [Lentisphaeria bacterium]
MKLISIAFAMFLLQAVSYSADQTVQLPVIRDNSIDLYPSEENVNAGRQDQIRIKGNQHLVAMAFDTSAIKGKLVKSATLVCYQGEKKIDHVTISTIQADWDEYKSNALTSGMQEEEGWGVPETRFPAVTGGNSNSLVCHSFSEIKSGAYHWQVDPDIIHACATGAAYGITVHESSADYSRNPTIWSREKKKKEPYLLVTYCEDESMPRKAEILKTSDNGDPNSLRLVVKAPSAGLTYEVKVNGRNLPRWNIPFVKPNMNQIIPVRDMGLKAGEPLEVSVATIGRTGEKAQAVSASTNVPRTEKIAVPKIAKLARAEGTAKIHGIIPLEDKYEASGKPVGELPEDYLARNEVFDGETIHLAAARGEVVGFQTLIKGTGTLTVKCDMPELRTEMYEATYVDTPKGKIPDPLIPLRELTLSDTRPVPVCVDIYVPFEFSNKEVKGTLSLSNGVRIPVELRIRDFALPKEATFSCEMNSYGLPDSVRAYYRLQEIAYDHRVHCNILHYPHGSAAPDARKCNMDMRLPSGRRMNENYYNDIKPGAKQTWWVDFTEAFGPYLSGQYFKNSYRGPIPSPGFYLTFHESWPLNVRKFFNGNPDAYEAFKTSPMYAKTFIEVLRDFISLTRNEGWTRTEFQIYLNNKGKLDDPKLSPWVLDEPSSYWDYRALAFYADLVRQAKGADCPVPLNFRIDISRPEFDRGELAGKANLWVVGMDAFRKYHRLLLDRTELTGEEIWTYSGSNNVEDSNLSIQAWAVESYAGGARGIVPWQTIVRGREPLAKGDSLAIFDLVDDSGKEPVIYHSMRLKAYRRAQQDIEYLELMRMKFDLSPGQINAFIRSFVSFSGEVIRKNEDDAGAVKSEYVTPENFRRMREAAAELIQGGK